MAMQNTPTPAEMEMSNRRFAIEQAVKLGHIEGTNVSDTARDFLSILQDNPVIERPPVGFALNEEQQ